MHVRHGGHRAEIQEQSTPLGRHFNECGVGNMVIQMIDCVKDGEEEGLRCLEGFGQNMLACFVAHGNINIMNEMRRGRGGVPPVFLQLLGM